MSAINNYKQLKEASTERIVQLFNQTAAVDTIQTLGFLRNELALREAEELNCKVLSLTEDMQKKTEAIHDMTKTIKVLTGINVAAVVIQIIVAICK